MHTSSWKVLADAIAPEGKGTGRGSRPMLRSKETKASTVLSHTLTPELGHEPHILPQISISIAGGEKRGR